MATLVLTGLGSAIGGPIGGAIGGLIGNAVDHATLFRPKGRSGPRLTELRVQTSSYGAAIPLVFGTMRIAGSVIWSTDLIESRSKAGGGKGRPSVATYSYSASFAVLLSGRAIRGVGRIWADGKLLRGAAGDLKAKGVLRVHPGGEDQAVDPLIASAEGMTPAYRGAAYAVFEQLALADFGNRIPSLSFEVIGDDGAVTVGAIGAACGPVVGGGLAMLDGFAASGTARDVLALMAQAGGGWWAADGDAVRWHDARDADLVVLDEGRGQRTTSPADTVPGAVAVSHYDPARDWQAGSQQVRIPTDGPGGSLREERVEMPAALSADAAKTLAAALLARGRVERVRRVVTTGLGGMAIGPGQVVRISGEAGRWRVVEVAVEAVTTRLTLVPVAPATLPVAAAGGRALTAADATIGTTRLVLAETPALDETLLTQLRVTVVANGTGRGWRGAALLWSVDDGASWTAAGGTAAPGVPGVVDIAPPAAPATLRDTEGLFVVRLHRADMMLADADDAMLDRGGNLAVAGEELFQFGRAEPLGDGRWRLSRLLRGRRGSGAALAGDGFALVDAETARTIDLPVEAVGRTLRVLATGVGDDEPAETRLVLHGHSVRPPSPVGARIERLADGGVTVRWTRRSRAGWRWIDGVDAPLGEETERWRVTVMRGAMVEERWLSEAALTLTAADVAGGAMLAVRQSGMWGESAPLTIMTGEM